MVGGICIILLLGTIPYSLSASSLLDIVNINLNLDEETNKGYGSDYFGGPDYGGSYGKGYGYGGRYGYEGYGRRYGPWAGAGVRAGVRASVGDGVGFGAGIPWEQNSDCMEMATDYFSNDIVPFDQTPRAGSWQECSELCRNKYAECKFWTLVRGKCLVKTSKDGKRYHQGAISGSRECGSIDGESVKQEDTFKYLYQQAYPGQLTPGQPEPPSGQLPPYKQEDTSNFLYQQVYPEEAIPGQQQPPPGQLPPFKQEDTSNFLYQQAYPGQLTPGQPEPPPGQFPPSHGNANGNGNENIGNKNGNTINIDCTQMYEIGTKGACVCHC